MSSGSDMVLDEGGNVGVPKRYKAQVMVCLLALSLFCMGASPKQSEVPPQAFFADYFSGRVVLQGGVPPEGIVLVACIKDCETFRSEEITLDIEGKFALMEVNPDDRFLRGDEILFYLANAHGKIQAEETIPFEGEYSIVEIVLHFNSELPKPMAPPALPEVGDPLLALLPKVAIILGVMFVGTGGLLTLIGFRRKFDAIGSGK